MENRRLKPGTGNQGNTHPTTGKQPPAGTALARWKVWLRGTTGEGLPRFFLAFMLLFGVGMGLVFLLGDQGWLAYSSLQAEASQLKQDVQRLHIRRETLTQQIEGLNNDPEYIEFLARRDLRYVRRGETVVEFVPTPDWEAALREGR